MLKFKIKEHIKPNKEVVDLLTNFRYEINNGYIKEIINTNIQTIKPVEYIITYPKKLTILEYKVNEINNKNFYIKEHNEKYNLSEIKKILKNLQK